MAKVDEKTQSSRQEGMPAVRCEKAPELSGSVRISGSKNVGLKLLTTVPMFHVPVSLKQVPRNNQVRYLLDLLKSFGTTVSTDADTPDGFNLSVHAKTILRQEFEYHEIAWCRHMFLMAVSVLLRTGFVSVPVPGYSHYGPRPIDGQINGLRQMGAVVYPVENGKVRIETPKGGLRGTDIFLPFPSNAVTEALLWAAVAAKGVTTIHGAAQEPETIEIGRFFQQAGVNITGLETTAITVHGDGLDALSSSVSVTVVPDKIEAATFGAAVTICGGEILLDGVRNHHLAAVRAILTNLGTEIVNQDEHTWLLRSKGRPRPTNITTGPFPGFPTDTQGPYLAVLSIAEGVSVLDERLWPNRLSLAMELRRMGADINVLNGQIAIVRGVDRLSGAPVVGTDPRATAALILAGLFADGETTITGLDLLDNAYDSFDEKLRSLGARVDRVIVPAPFYSRHHPMYGRLEAF